jgi:hypothetical protein
METTKTHRQNNNWNVYYRPYSRGPEYKMTIIALSERTARFIATQKLGKTSHYDARITRIVKEA